MPDEEERSYRVFVWLTRILVPGGFVTGGDSCGRFRCVRLKDILVAGGDSYG